MISRNLALDNSFYLQFNNAGQTDYVVNLFNSGGAAQTTFVSSYLWGYENIAITNLVNSVFTNNTTVIILDSSANVISSVNMLAGQTLSQYLLAANPIIDINGNIGAITMELAQSPNIYNARITNLPDVSKLAFSPDPSVQAMPVITTYAAQNPFVTSQSTVPIQVIKESENGNSYRIMTVDVFSQKSEQILEGIDYGQKDANGNRFIEGLNPIIDPYQLNSVSIRSLDSGGMIIDVDTIFRYNIQAISSARLTFNYVKGNIELMRGFDQAFIQRLLFQYATEKKILDEQRFRELTIQ